MLPQFSYIIREMTNTKKTTSGFNVVVDGATVDLFGVTDCEDCKGRGEIDIAPSGACYELWEDCETCSGMGAT